MSEKFDCESKVPDWHKIEESRYCVGWWKRSQFPEFDPDNVSTAMKRVRSEASIILSQYEDMKREGFDPKVKSFAERKSQILVDSH